MARVLAAAAILTAAAASVQAAVPASAAAAQTDLSFISNSTWTADPVAGRVHVAVSLTATSHTVDTDARRYFYDQVQLTLPPAATDFTATSTIGDPLPAIVESSSPSGVVVVASLGQRLYSGQTGTVNLKFDLVDTGGSTDRDLRLSHNLMSFPVSAFGSAGTPGSTVTVVFPPDFAVQEEFGGLTRAVFGSGEVVFSSGTIDDSTALSAWFTAVQPVPQSDFLSRSVTIGPLHVTLRYWADDPGWADRVDLVLSEGYPVLKDLIGLGDPSTTSLTVVEASTQEIGGFSGSYDQATGNVQISYFADPFVILHEAAHMWFNRDLTGDRWIQEGFASYYGEQAVLKLGLTNHAPVLTARISQAAIPLNDWITTGQPSSATDAYLYAATLELADRIAALAGQDGLRSVWAEARAGRAAYQPNHATSHEAAPSIAISWRQLLDLLEQTTGRRFEPIWSQWIVDPAQAPLLQQRATTLSEYADTQSQAGSWDLAPEVRRALDLWQFEDARSLLAQDRAILTQRDEIASAAATQGTNPPGTLKTLFQASGAAAASAEAATELAALNAIAAARQAESDNRGGARAFGLLGADPQADLVAAQKAFAAGDMAKALSSANSAKAAWQGANGTGQARILGGFALLAGLLLLLVAFSLTRTGRKPSAAAPVPTGDESAENGAGATADAPDPASTSVSATTPATTPATASASGPVSASAPATAPIPIQARLTARIRDAVASRAALRAPSVVAASSVESVAAAATPLPALSSVRANAGDDMTSPLAKSGDHAAGIGKSGHHAPGNGKPDKGAGSGSSAGSGAADAASGLGAHGPHHSHTSHASHAQNAHNGDQALDATDAALTLDEGVASSTLDGSAESAYDLLQRGTALLADRHNAQAAVVLERASRVEPGKGSILEALGRAYFNSGQHARAAETFEALLEVDPSAHYGHFALGLSFARLGRPMEARTHLRLAVALDPESDTYRKALRKAESAVV